MHQIVYVSRTQAGVPGFFTNGMLAISLTELEYEACRISYKTYVALCRRWHFLSAPETNYFDKS